MANNELEISYASPKGTGFNTGKPLSDLSLDDVKNAAMMSGGGLDPLAGKFISEEQGIANAKNNSHIANTENGEIRMSGIASSGVAIGDRVYHKELKCEGIITGILAEGKALLRLDKGKEGKTNIKNLVKL